MGKIPPANVRATGDMGSVPESGRSPAGGSGKSSILAGIIPWTEEPGQLQAMKSQRVGSDGACMRANCISVPSFAYARS